MAVEIVLPKLGLAMEEGILSEWLAAEGDTITEGQPLYTLESDKSAQEVDAPASGTLHIIVQATDETLPVGTVLGEIR